MDISVEKIASLAYLELSASQKKTFGSQLSQILDYVQQLNKVPMTPEESKEMGAFHVLTAFMKQLDLKAEPYLRKEDHSVECNSLVLSNEEATSNAPKLSGLPGEMLYEVPSIIER